MRSSHSRIAAGVLAALVLGTFGPVSRAVSMESRRHVDIAGPGVPGPTERPLHHSVSRGATAATILRADQDVVELRLHVDESHVVRGGPGRHETRVVAEEFPRARLSRRACVQHECVEQRYEGTGTFEISDTQRRFTATLTGAHGSCTVSAVWDVDQRPSPDASSPSYRVGRRALASGSAETSCFGTFAWQLREGDVYDQVGQYTWPR